MTQAKLCFYIFTRFSRILIRWDQFQSQQKPKPATRCSHTRWRGESGNKMQRRQQNTSRPREMPSDKIQRGLVYEKDGTFRFSGLSGKSERGRLETTGQTERSINTWRKENPINQREPELAVTGTGITVTGARIHLAWYQTVVLYSWKGWSGSQDARGGEVHEGICQQ